MDAVCFKGISLLLLSESKLFTVFKLSSVGTSREDFENTCAVNLLLSVPNIYSKIVLGASNLKLLEG